MCRPVVRTVSSGRHGAINDDASSMPLVTCEHGPVATVTNATDQRPARRLPPQGRVAGEAMVSFGRFEEAKTQWIHCSFSANGGWHLFLGLAHSTFTSGATELILRTSDGVLRRCRNLCLSAMLEAVRASTGRTIDIDIVNRVLLQPHWQTQVDLTDF